MCRTGVFLLINFHCPAYVLGYLTVFVIVQVLCLMKLRGIFWDSKNGQLLSVALNYPEGSRTWPGYVLLRLARGLLAFHCWRGRQGETLRTGYSLRFQTPLVHSVLQALECFLVMVMNYEERSSINFFLLPESVDPNSLTLAFPSQPLYSSQAPPTCLIFGFYHWVYREKHL